MDQQPAPQQPECAGGTYTPPAPLTLGQELHRYAQTFELAHQQQLQIDAAFDQAVGEDRR